MRAKITLIVPMSEYKAAFGYTPTKEEAENTFRDRFVADYNDCGPILVIGNPSFWGTKQISNRFFKHAAKFANTIAFIVPRSFRKVSIQNKLPLNFWLAREIEIPSNSFLLNGIEYSVPCVFQAWDKLSTSREKITFSTQSKYFSFTKKILKKLISEPNEQAAMQEKHFQTKTER